MSHLSDRDSLLARLANTGTNDADPWALLAATEPTHDVRQSDAEGKKIDDLIDQINQRINKTGEATGDIEESAPEHLKNDFLPVEPESFDAAQLAESQVESLIIKYLLARGDASGRNIAEQVRLPFVLVDALLRAMKNDQLVVHRADAPMNDYQYQLTEMGRERARRCAAHSTYFGSAPVALSDYIASVGAQSLSKQHPTVHDLNRAFADLLLNKTMLDRLGPAINSGRGLFLFGPPGNGKTSIAERATAAFGQSIWIPRALDVDGEIIRLFDPINHEELPLPANSALWDQRKIDRRWIRIRRPTIVAGGELTMASLEVTFSPSTGISEAPLQLKSNCGILVIDDFGRQRMSIEELLNRWIVPLEKRVDFLNMANGKKVGVPFDQLIIFSTNLEPRELVDEAFLRRIPYKIEAGDPTEEEFRALFRELCAKLGFEYREEPVNYLVETHYRNVNRPFRFCQPRDLLMQIRNYCIYYDLPMELTSDHLDKAVANYFAVM